MRLDQSNTHHATRYGLARIAAAGSATCIGTFLSPSDEMRMKGREMVGRTLNANAGKSPESIAPAEPRRTHM